VVASSSRLKPGEQGKITARMSTELKKGLTYGSFGVVSNDPRRPKVVLILKAMITENILPLLQPEICK
jgi:dUTPase